MQTTESSPKHSPQQFPFQILVMSVCVAELNRQALRVRGTDIMANVDKLLEFVDKECSRPNYEIPCPDGVTLNQPILINFLHYGDTYRHQITQNDLRNGKITLDPITIINQLIPEIKITRANNGFDLTIL